MQRRELAVVLDPVDVDMDQALVPEIVAILGGTGEPRQPARLVALDREDRVRDEARLVPLGGEIGDGGIEQERHVVVHGLNDRDVAAAGQVSD